MRKTPSYLKGLAETRARLAGDIERYRMVIEDVGRQLLKAETELEACDLLIRKFDSRLRPGRIPPIRAHRLPGKRGLIRATLIAILTERTPACLTTRELGWETAMRLGFEFAMPTHYSRWIHNSIHAQLLRLVDEGLVVREPEVAGVSGAAARWRSGADCAPSLVHSPARV